MFRTQILLTLLSTRLQVFRIAAALPEIAARDAAAVEVSAIGVQLFSAISESFSDGQDVTFLQTGAGISMASVLAQDSRSDAAETERAEDVARLERAAERARAEDVSRQAEVHEKAQPPLFFQVDSSTNKIVDGATSMSTDVWAPSRQQCVLLLALASFVAFIALRLACTSASLEKATARQERSTDAAPQREESAQSKGSHAAHADVDEEGESTDEDSYPLGFNVKDQQDIAASVACGEEGSPGQSTSTLEEHQ